MSPKGKKKTRGSVADRSLTDMKCYFESQDWAEMWEEFYLGLNENGFPKYRTLHQFCKEKARNTTQYSFLMWYLGPISKNANNQPTTTLGKKFGGGWDFVSGPQDWEFKRENKGWVSNESREQYAKLVASKIGALEKLEEVGSHVLLRNMNDALHISDMIDEQFRAGIMLPNFSDRRNAERSRLYVELKTKAHKLAITNWEAYTTSLGVNVTSMDCLTQMLASVYINKLASVEDKKDGVQGILKNIVESAILKSHQFGNPLPDDIQTKLIEAVPEPTYKPPKKAN